MPFAVAEGEDGWVGSVVWLGFVDVLLPNFEGWDDDLRILFPFISK